MMESKIYEQAAGLMMAYPKSHPVKFEFSRDENIRMLNEFKAKFAPEVLKSLSDEKLLDYIFLNENNNDSLCYHLEFNPELKKAHGSISGGSSFKFGLFQRHQDGKWVTGSSLKPRILSEAEALQFAKTVRDSLVKGCEMIQSRTLDSVAAYEKLDDDLNEQIGSLAGYTWVQKYFHLIFPDDFAAWYSYDWLKHFLYGFGILPSAKYYGMNGQLNLIKKRTGYISPEFDNVCYAMFGKFRHFYRLESDDAGKMREKGIVAIGWKETGDLRNYIKNGSLNKNKLASALSAHYFQNDKKTASQKAGEMKAFYETPSDAVITVMSGSRLIAFVDDLSPYYYDEDMAHQKTGTWHASFDESDTLPESEGDQTTFSRINNPENLLYLYKKYYRPDGYSDEEYVPIQFHTGYQSSFERNRILFGAPGTGKSYTMNKEAKELIGEGNEEDYERVTFHPDYSYAHFVGTYKPVPSQDTITYAYVPGPFMRVYVKALKNSREAHIRPFLLIIEEINRANAAAVFGDIFQLLDRGDDHVSEYPVQASEDIKAYLARELGGKPDNYSKISIPDNMFIWATMNSADQGVFPMDTAFKRRWDFTYLGIDECDELIRGKYVYLGDQKVEWNKLRKAINHFLAKEKINEDKQLGPYFLARSIVVPDAGDEIDRDKFIRVFKNKVIMYLFEDAAKQKQSKLFAGCDSMRYSDICREFEKKGIGIFNQDIQNEAEPETSNGGPAD